jgi:hypothetical protein
MVGDDVLQAFARLNSDPSLRPIVEELERRREAAREAMETATDLTSMGRAQGCSMLAGELLNLAQGARDALAKRQSVRSGLT